MDDELDRAARRTAINLMRLNEAVEHADVEHYSTRITRKGWTKQEERRDVLDRHYRDWFNRQGGME